MYLYLNCTIKQIHIFHSSILYSVMCNMHIPDWDTDQGLVTMKYLYLPLASQVSFTLFFYGLNRLLVNQVEKYPLKLFFWHLKLGGNITEIMIVDTVNCLGKNIF